MIPKILITVGAGCIGSHTAVELMNSGQAVVIVDNLCNSSTKVLNSLAALCCRKFKFVQADVRDAAALDRIFADNQTSGVGHFAGLKSLAHPALGWKATLDVERMCAAVWRWHSQCPDGY